MPHTPAHSCLPCPHLPTIALRPPPPFSPRRSIAAVGPIVYSLAADGSVRGWPLAALPAPAADAWRSALLAGLHEQEVSVLAGTWNVNEGRPSRHALQMWLGERSARAQVGSMRGVGRWALQLRRGRQRGPLGW